MKILVLNSGSSSQKSCLYEIGDSVPDDPPPPQWEGKIEWDGEVAEVSLKNAKGAARKERTKAGSRAEATEQLLGNLWDGDARAISAPSEIDVVGHRFVHGGPHYEDPVFLTPEVKSAIAEVSAFAPLHNRAELEGMEIIEKLLGAVPQIAVFDTGFHHKMPLAAKVYPGPYDWFSDGIHRYGFHGINHQYCAGRAARLLGRDSDVLKLVSCHLGNGCSLAAIESGRSVDTTMGFTPLDGLMMGTRSGSVDPGILTDLARQEKQTGEQLDNLLNKKSGLLGIAGFSGDMREIIEEMKASGATAPASAKSTDAKSPNSASTPAASALPIDAGDKSARAKLAFDIFIHRLRREIGSMIAVLGGLDALVFTAGIGENSADVRAAACDALAFAGVHLDAAKNAQLGAQGAEHGSNAGSGPADADIATAASPARVLVIKAQEDWAIARACF